MNSMITDNIIKARQPDNTVHILNSLWPSDTIAGVSLSLIIWRHQAITCNRVDLSSMGPSDIRLSAHYRDVIMSSLASQITSLTIVYSTVYSRAGQRKHQSSASLAFVWEIHRWPVNSPQKWPVTRKLFPFDDVIMKWTRDTSAINQCNQYGNYVSKSGGNELKWYAVHFLPSLSRKIKNLARSWKMAGLSSFSTIISQNGWIHCTQTEFGLGLKEKDTQASFYQQIIAEICAWISIHIHCFTWDVITPPCKSFTVIWLHRRWS